MFIIPATVAVCLALSIQSAPVDTPVAQIDFNRQIRPLLSDSCFSCHGPDEKERKAGLRLDTREGLFGALKDGSHAVITGNPDDSELIARIESDDANSVMPPPTSGKHLTPDQAKLFRAWVQQGAPWSNHWAFDAPLRSAVPIVANQAWVKTPIDAFLLKKLESEGLTPNGEVDKETLIRRVTLDMTGLPPTPQEIDAFLVDTAPDAYEKVVDRLLKSVQYGEHMARFWLDAARYGDTHGLHLDNYREMWPYRDWVVQAFNSNVPFDRFVVEQLAGDMLPDPTLDQKIASGFNRAHVTTSEGGSIDEEVYVRNVVDRVDTTGTVFLGLTVGCARCHDHKYDPIRAKDYYSLFAIFNSCDENPLDGNASRHPPIVQVPSSEQSQQIAALRETAGAIRTKITEEVAKTPYDSQADEGQTEYVERLDYVWFEDELPPNAKPQGPGTWPFASNPDHPVASGARSVRNQTEGLGQQVFESARPLLIGEGDTLFAYVFIDPTNPPKEIMLQWFSDAWKHRAYWGENVIDWGADNTTERKLIGPLPKTAQWVRLEVEAQAVGIKPGTKITGLAFTQQGGTAYWDKAGAVTWTPQEGQQFDTLSAWIKTQKATKLANLPANLQEILKKERAGRSSDELKALTAYFIENGYSKAQQAVVPLKMELAKAEQQVKQLDDSIATTLVSKEKAEPKPAFILNRGEYDQKREQVERATPAFLPPLKPDVPKNRLGFAQWLVTPEHPLTSRVTVNRLWLQFFGTGLVKTAEDFGLQGEPPSHPELLDWLAVDFRENGWDMKRFIKQMLMSSAYRQSARVTPDKLAKDPQNRLLSRGARFRLDAESLRDQALFLGGLLIDKVGGPGVKPPQPAGLWEAVGFVGSNTAIFVADTGNEKVHRRSLYTFWKRTSPPPQMTIVDAPSREACTVRRERTNTPMQALLLMNEPQYVEASRGLAQRGMREAGSSDEDRLNYMFRLATGRRPDAREFTSLKALLDDVRAHYKADPEAGKLLIQTGETKPDATLDPAELAAWTMIANTILNLDEVVTKG